MPATTGRHLERLLERLDGRPQLQVSPTTRFANPGNTNFLALRSQTRSSLATHPQGTRGIYDGAEGAYMTVPGRHI